MHMSTSRSVRGICRDMSEAATHSICSPAAAAPCHASSQQWARVVRPDPPTPAQGLCGSDWSPPTGVDTPPSLLAGLTLLVSGFCFRHVGVPGSAPWDPRQACWDIGHPRLWCDPMTPGQAQGLQVCWTNGLGHTCPGRCHRSRFGASARMGCGLGSLCPRGWARLFHSWPLDLVSGHTHTRWPQVGVASGCSSARCGYVGAQATLGRHTWCQGSPCRWA